MITVKVNSPPGDQKANRQREIWVLGRERKKGKSPEQFEETTPKEENPV